MLGSILKCRNPASSFSDMEILQPTYRSISAALSTLLISFITDGSFRIVSKSSWIRRLTTSRRIPGDFERSCKSIAISDIPERPSLIVKSASSSPSTIQMTSSRSAFSFAIADKGCSSSRLYNRRILTFGSTANCSTVRIFLSSWRKVTLCFDS